MYRFFVVLFFTPFICFSQTTSLQYTNLIKKADRCYYAKNYKLAATTYSQAFKANKWDGLVEDKYNAACAWALADNKDSSFHYLFSMVNKNNYSNYEDVISEGDFKPLHKDKRWESLLKSIILNIEAIEAKLNKPLIKRLDSIYYNDQNNRKKIAEIKTKYGVESIEMKTLFKEIKITDSLNLIKVENIIETYGWLGVDKIGEEGNETLFLVIQHADLKTQEKYLPIIREAVKNGNADKKQLALLEDRVAMGQGKKQIYGSQIIIDSKTGKYIIAPIIDSINVNKRRSQMGLEPLEEYVKHWGIIIESEKVNSSMINSDFNNAIEIKDSIVGVFNTGKGFGKVLEFKHSLELKEDNSAWFKFTIDMDTLLTFDIVPVNPKDDYDFIILKCIDPNCIDKIKTGEIRPDRWCFSMNYSKKGSTGLSEYASERYVGAGHGIGYAEALPVKAGETFYLMINWPAVYSRKPEGFTIYFYNYWPHRPKELLGTKTNKPIILENVYFETNKSKLLNQSELALDKLAIEMQKNKNMKIEVRGHTDNTGDENKNQQLSEQRAQAIVDYLISKSIDKSRLSFKGFGSQSPIATNDTEEGKMKNRRVEFIILSK